MAIDTATKRASVGFHPPMPNGSFGLDDRLATGLTYAGASPPAPAAPPTGRTAGFVASWESADDWLAFDLDEQVGGTTHTRSSAASLSLAGAFWGRINGSGAANSASRRGLRWAEAQSALEVVLLLRFGSGTFSTAQDSPGGGGDEYEIVRVTNDTPANLAGLVAYKTTGGDGRLAGFVADSGGAKTYVPGVLSLGAVADWPSRAIGLRLVVLAPTGPALAELQLREVDGGRYVEHGRASVAAVSGGIRRLYFGLGTMGAGDALEWAIDDLLVGPGIP